jgi:hypothetical protein
MRAIARDRRRGWFGIVPTLGPLNGWDLILIDRYWGERSGSQERALWEPPRKP